MIADRSHWLVAEVLAGYRGALDDFTIVTHTLCTSRERAPAI
jgi:hypothetical protein